MYATLPAYDSSAYVTAPAAPLAPPPPQIQMQWAPQWPPPAAALPPAQFAWLPPDIAQWQQAQAQAQLQQAQAQAQAQEQWQQWQQWQQQQMAAYMATTAAPPAAPPPPFVPDEPGVRNAPSNYKHVPGLMRSVPPAGTRSKRRDNLSK